MSTSDLLLPLRSLGLLAICVVLTAVSAGYTFAQSYDCTLDCDEIDVLVEVRGGGCYEYKSPRCFVAGFGGGVFINGGFPPSHSCAFTGSEPRIDMWVWQPGDCTALCDDGDWSEGTVITIATKPPPGDAAHNRCIPPPSGSVPPPE